MIKITEDTKDLNSLGYIIFWFLNKFLSISVNSYGTKTADHIWEFWKKRFWCYQHCGENIMFTRFQLLYLISVNSRANGLPKYFSDLDLNFTYFYRMKICYSNSFITLCTGFKNFLILGSLRYNSCEAHSQNYMYASPEYHRLIGRRISISGPCSKSSIWVVTSWDRFFKIIK